MKKIMLMLVICAVFFGLELTALSNSATAKPVTGELRIGTNPTGSLFYAIGSAIARVVSNHSKIVVKVMPFGGIREYAPLMARGEIDLGITNCFEGWQAYYGRMAYEKQTKGKGYPIRLLEVGCPNWIIFVGTGSSSVRTIPDLKGKRIAGKYRIHITCHYLNKALLANGGLSLKDVKILPVMTYPEGVKKVIEGRCDFAVGSIGSGILKQLKASKGITYVPIDPSPEAVKRMAAEFYGSYAAQVSPEKGMKKIWAMAYSIDLVARESLSDEAAYQVVKATWENWKELGAIHGKLKGWKPQGMATLKATIPYHPGAIRWYKEKGVWTQELEAHQAKLLAAKK